MSGKGMTKALRCSDCAFMNSLKVPVQRRTFTSSSSRQRHGAVPAFTSTSSPKLDNLLKLIRERIILPTHLVKEQRDLIFKPKYIKLISTDPVTATIAGEDFRLQHISKKTDVPNAKESLFKAISLMKDKQDWGNLPNLLTGLKQAKTKLQPWQIYKIVRLAGQAGRQDVILECARRAEDTGFRLDDPELVHQVLFWIQHQALVHEWSAKKTNKSMAWAEMVIQMMDDPKHGRKVRSHSEKQTQPEVSGIALQLAAMQALQTMEGKDAEGRVAQYATRLLGTSVDFQNPVSEHPRDINPWLLKVLPTLHGMTVAQSILEPSSKTAAELKIKLGELQSLAGSYREKLMEATSDSENAPMSLWLHSQLFPSTS